MPVINGKKVVHLPSATKQEVLDIYGEKRPHRKAIIERPEGNITINDHLPTRLKPDDKIKIVPDRVKASNSMDFTYGGNKTNFQKQLIFDQVSDIELKFTKQPIEIDDNFNWILINNY